MNRNHAALRTPAKLLRSLLLIALSAIVTTSEAALLALADAPLYLITAVQPNILLTFDDSGSMQSGFIPDTISGTAYSGTPLGCAANINGVYYNPMHKYDPPLGANRQPINIASPTLFGAAYLNGYFPARAYTAPNGANVNAINLATNYRPTWDADFANNALTYRDCGQGGAQAAYYFVYDVSLAGCPPASTTKTACYRKVVVSATSGTGPAGADERQNFANWFSYYRTRNMMAKGAVGTAYSRLSDYVRVAAQHLYLNAAAESTGSSNALFPGSFAANALQPFGGANRTDFYTRLFNSPANANTPLREAMVRAGNYLTTADPYLDTPGAAVGSTNQERACRQNFHVLVTDGYWNGPNGPFAPAGGDADRTSFTLPTPDPSIAIDAPVNQFSNAAIINYPAGGKRPYSGINASAATSNTPSLADVAFYYWSHDLRGLNNIVPPRLVSNTGSDANTIFWDSKNDPATWQHMVNFTIGLGIPGTLTASDATLASITAGTTNWPSPSNNNTAGNNIDDLWHAAVNSRGMYFSANNPVDLSNAFVAVVNQINDRTSAASSVTMNSGTLTTSSYVYQSKFHSGDWSGQLLAYPINPSTGEIVDLNSPAWDASKVLSTLQDYTARQILSYNPSSRSGIRFGWPANPATPAANELNTTQISDLNFNSATATSDGQGEARLNWLRGDASNETATTLNFRKRKRMCGAAECPPGTNNGWLGDTIDSTPVYVGAPPFNYPDTLETGNPYSTFKTSNSSRTPIVYVGANDGMLHAFNANSGVEVFAYVPSIFYSKLTDLTNSTYGHEYFVNGNHTVIDAFVNGRWRTVLAGALRKGGRGIYALDVSNPSLVNEGNASASVLWEFSNNNDPDMGYSFAEPVITRLHNGKWAVIVGNGYNSTESGSATGHAVAYVLDIEKGIGNNWTATDIIKLDTGSGTLAFPNGLSTTSVVDVDGDYIADYIYAGDIQGNLWRWDIRDSMSANWAGTKTLIFSAGSTHPITDRPVVGKHPDGLGGVMVYFGTGKYLESSDASIAGSTTQTFYGIWDNNATAPISSASLLTQTISGTATDSGGTFRLLSDKPINWSTQKGWRLDLPSPGERVVADPILRNGVVIFTTVIPSSDPCTFGGSGWLMEVNASNGGTPAAPVLDTNGDGIVDGADMLGTLGSKKPAAGVQFGTIPAMPGILQSDPNVAGGTACGGGECKFINSSDGSVKRVVERPNSCNECRTSWRQRR